MTGLWPSNLLIAVTLALMSYRAVTGDVVPYYLLVWALAYHHWQAHSFLSDGSSKRADSIRLGIAIGWTIMAGAFTWLN